MCACQNKNRTICSLKHSLLRAVGNKETAKNILSNPDLDTEQLAILGEVIDGKTVREHIQAYAALPEFSFLEFIALKEKILNCRNNLSSDYLFEKRSPHSLIRKLSLVG